MAKTLYVSNLPPGVDETRLCALFEAFGSVETMEPAHFRSDEVMDAALLTMADAAAAEAIRHMNGMDLDGFRLAVTWAEPEPPIRSNHETHTFTKQLIEQLGEDPAAQSRIERVVRLGSVEFVRAILEETLAIEAAGGMMTADGERRRTAGGVFFYLVRGRVSDNMRHEMFYARKKAEPQPPAPEKAKKPKQAQPAAAPPPPPVPEAPPVSTGELQAARDKLAALRGSLAEAQHTLEDIQAGPASKKAGLFSALKNVVDVQKQIDAVLKDYPQLKNE